MTTTYNYIRSWKLWELDENFVEFTWGGPSMITGLVIVPKNQIIAIEKD